MQRFQNSTTCSGEFLVRCLFCNVRQKKKKSPLTSQARYKSNAPFRSFSFNCALSSFSTISFPANATDNTPHLQLKRILYGSLQHFQNVISVLQEKIHLQKLNNAFSSRHLQTSVVGLSASTRPTISSNTFPRHSDEINIALYFL